MEIVVMVEDVEEYYREVKSFAHIVEELKNKPWGLKDFRISDPFGFYIRFTSHHNILDPRNAVK